jgi:hypothetical protein
MGVGREVYCARIGAFMLTNGISAMCMERKDIKIILEQYGIKIPRIKLEMHSSGTTQTI